VGNTSEEFNLVTLLHNISLLSASHSVCVCESLLVNVEIITLLDISCIFIHNLVVVRVL
jgi:hypothetical protein